MGNVLVLYDSRTGNTKKMAELVAEGARRVADTEVRLRSVEEATKEDVLWCHGMAVGTPTNMGIVSWKLKRFFDDVIGDLWGKIDGKIGCAFSSSGGWGGGNEVACLSVLY
ncbi:MAG: flavodoxin family protein, partial [Aquificota bacterium]